jgi:hypothetical protein
MPELVTAKPAESGAGKPTGPQGDGSHLVPIAGKLLVGFPQLRIGHCCGLAFAMVGPCQQILKLDRLFGLSVTRHDGRMRPVPVGSSGPSHRPKIKPRRVGDRGGV